MTTGMGVDVRDILAISFAAILMQSCIIQGPCETEIIDRSMSPNQEYTAVLFSRNCGATTGENFQVSIIGRNEHLNGDGNALILDHAPKYGRMWNPRWVSDEELELSIPNSARVFRQNSSAGSINIEYNWIDSP